MSTTIILDCDPGIDDALAIAFAAGSPELELAGLTTVAGNVELAKTTANALAVASFVGLGSVPVTAGCGTPLLRPALHAGHVHGENGLGGAVLPTPAGRPRRGTRSTSSSKRRRPRPGEITLVATGPLTNIGLALRREPRLASWVGDFVIMGGSASRGNVTPAAEFNIWADPEAAAIVFGAPWPDGVRMIGLDVTLLARATAAVQERMRDARRARLAAAASRPSRSTGTRPTPPASRRCTTCARSSRSPTPRSSPTRRPMVQVETHGTLTSGMTVTEFSTIRHPERAGGDRDRGRSLLGHRCSTPTRRSPRGWRTPALAGRHRDPLRGRRRMPAW